MVKRIYLDTCVYIYHLEAHPHFSSAARRFFQNAEQKVVRLVASPLILQEIMSGVYVDEDSSDLSGDIYGLLSSHPGIHWEPYTLEIADLVAKIRASTSIKTPDAIHLATALTAECDEFVTHDQVLIAAIRKSGIPIRATGLVVK